MYDQGLLRNFGITELFRILSEVPEADDFAKFRSFPAISVDKFFQNLTLDSAEVLNNSRTVPLKMCHFADFH